MRTFVQDVRYGLRMLGKNPGFTVVAVTALALGIGANSAIFSVVNAVLLRPLPYKDPGRLVKVWETYPQFPKVEASVPNLLDWKAQNHVFEEIAAYRTGENGFNLTGVGEPERIQGTFASASLFPLLGMQAALGRTFLPKEDKPGGEPVVILSHRLWQRRLGSDPSLIGKAVTLNGRSYMVVGVMPRGFAFPSWAELWMPMGQMGTDELTSRVYHPLEVIARLKPGITLMQAEAEMDTISHRLQQQYPKTNRGWNVRLVPLDQELLGNLRRALLVLLGATGLVLVIACANVANLLLARAAARQKEIAIRAALGAGRWRLTRQLLTESVLLSFLGGALGLLLALWVLDLLVALGPTEIPGVKEIGIDARVLGFTVLISFLTGAIFGLVPALQVSKTDLNETLKEGARTSTSGFHGSRLRSPRVVSEVALALVLLVGAGLLIKSFLRLLRVDPGFNPHRVLTLRIDLPDSKYSSNDRIAAFYQQLSQRIKTLPGVETVGMINYLPLSPESTNRTRFTVEGRPVSEFETLPVAELRSINPDYFRAMRSPLLKGRYFIDTEKVSVCIINETMARRFFPHEDPIGKRVNTGDLAPQPFWLSIIGVVGDVRHFGLDDRARFDVYVNSTESEMYLVVRTASDPLSLAPAVRREVQAVDKDVPVSNVTTMDQILSNSLSSRRFSMLLLGIFAGLALILAAVGIYGVISYSVTQRTHEIGIRMALGAERSDVLRLVVRQGMVLTLAGVGAGVAGSLALTRFLSSLLYEVRPTDPATFVSISLLLTGVALLATYIPARRATKVDPMVALRYE